MKSLEKAILAVAATSLLASCTPDSPTGGGEDPGELTPAVVDSKLDAFNHDLARVLAVVEPLEGSGEAQFQTLFSNDELSTLIKDHVEEIKSLTEVLKSMNQDERAEFSFLIRKELEFLEPRITDIYSAGAAAEDAFAPLFAEVHEALSGSL
jgi:hypothetical protein